MTESEKTIHRLENELDRVNVYTSSTHQIKAFCYSALEQLKNIKKAEKYDVFIIERAEKLIKYVEEMQKKAPKIENNPQV